MVSLLYLPPSVASYILSVCRYPIDINEELYLVIPEIVLAAAEGEIQLEK